MVVEHKHRIGFKGTILIEPKPFEPTKHQYDHDVAAVFAFLQRYGLTKEVKVNIEVNHATLAGLDFEHEIAAARAFGIFGSIDINRGDPRNGWDTDQFPNNAQELVPSMVQLVEDKGFTTGGFNFDAKLRRQSVDPADLYLAHIGGIDTLARALLAAADVVTDGGLERLRQGALPGMEQRTRQAHPERRIESGQPCGPRDREGSRSRAALGPSGIGGKHHRQTFEILSAGNSSGHTCIGGACCNAGADRSHPRHGVCRADSGLQGFQRGCERPRQ